ncbi:conjugal transfer protein TraB (plasmid) [Agrobacterium radiobacter]|uniref:Conjugal transfer protein TraB n=2 Tax=Agrobacterium tumefaciens TaxID=358 RepID=A0A2Z2PEY5_AGRTU|nr:MULTISPECIES: conjugal transfer protein TraB [Agrobacterium tumefaciens complex]ASK41527.1 conjugal transfer protein TraB [Agrobacterium tumefaciens]ASK47176.1 conjugal transfer protein TraB [Agrobacterium radiobacter]MQB27316.1 conjugal transfer protein TraB [Agrobacterium tumefaciens]NIB59150.1 conjugal transfer protein TraB [Agrobacterium tumefaciens]NSZ25310.1 conjugal transfer protein TraB [Agrobacterium tumefaciens]
MIADILARFRIPVFSVWRDQSSPLIRSRGSQPVADSCKSILLIAASIGCGRIGWSGEVLLLPLAMIFPALWATALSRLTAALVSAGYFLAASRGLPQGAANFYAASFWPGFLLWVAASTSFVFVHVALWKKHRSQGASGKKRADAAGAVRYQAALLLTGLPPFGITGWAHPLTAAGVLFPAWGWWGLFVTAAGLTVMTTRLWPAATIMLAAFWLWSTATWTPPNLPDGWRGVELHQDQKLGRDGSLAYQRNLIATVHRTIAEHPEAQVVVLPESALGFWTPTVENVWRDGLRGADVTVLAGAAVIGRQGYDNIMVSITADEAKIVYRERMPVPVSMWQPWLEWTGQGGGASAHFFANPFAEVAGIRNAPLICYEQLILWPVLQSMLYSPEVIVAVGNGWWTEGTSIVAIQRASVTAWAKLFGLPVVIAFNL